MPTSIAQVKDTRAGHENYKNGYYASGIKQKDLDHLSAHAMTFFYHQPYQNDFAEARNKAWERKPW